MKGVRRDRYGLRAYVKVGLIQREKRFPADTPAEALKRWRDDTRVELRTVAQRPAGKSETLREGAKRYLLHKKGTLVPASYRSLVCEIEAWTRELGHLPRTQITRALVLDQRQAWLTDVTDPKAPKTCNHRVRALRNLYHYLDGSHAPTPCDDVPKLKEPDARPQFVSAAVIRRVAQALTDPKIRARFMVLAATGQRPAQLKRAQPADVDLRRRVWFVRPAKGGYPIPVVLTQDMVVAWKAFKRAKAFGDFDGSDYAKALYAAGWPKHIRPYNAKHTVAITLGESEADWEDIKDWFGHRDVKSTRIYTGLILKRTRRTAARLEGRLGWK